MHLPETSNEVSGYDADALAFASVSSGRRAVLSHALLSVNHVVKLRVGSSSTD